MTARLQLNKPNLVWLEDREITAKVEVSEAIKLGCSVHLRASPIEIMALLREELGTEFDPVILEQYKMIFVIDVMIAGLIDLKMLGVDRSETYGGLNGGYVFADRILRDAKSLYRYRPILFMSERQLTPDLQDDLQYLRDKRDDDGTPHGPIMYFRKLNSAHLIEFKQVLSTI